MNHPAPPCVLRVDALDLRHANPALTALTFDLAAGVSLATGHEGCGKTSLLRALVEAPTAKAGAITLQHPALGRVNARDHAADWHHWLVRTAPNDAPPPEASPRAHWQAQAARLRGWRADALEDLLDGFQLAPHLDKGFHMLSAGTLRKVRLATALASGAVVTLLDDPFAALDAASIGFLRELLQDAADHPQRAWLLADHAPPADVPLATTIWLG